MNQPILRGPLTFVTRALLGIVFVTLAISQARAACTNVPGNGTYTVGHVSVPPGIASGELLKAVAIPDIVIQCDPSKRHVLVGSIGSLPARPFGGNILYIWSAPQIGYSVRDLESNKVLTATGNTSVETVLNSDIRGEVRIRPQVEFYYLGLPPDGTANPNTLVSNYAFAFKVCEQPSGTNCISVPSSQKFDLKGASMSIDKPTCQLTNIEFDLDPVEPIELNRPGATAKQKQLPLTITCSPGGISSMPQMVVSDTVDPANRDTNGLLKVASGPGAASGVAIRLTRGGGAVRIGANWNGPILGSGSSEELRFEASYYRLDERLQAGTVHALAMITINYR